MSYKSHAVGPARMFDHLYDPLFTTSGIKDIWRENHQALNSTAPVHIYPVYRTMFTDLPRCARNFYTLEQNPLPHLAPYGNFYATNGTGWDHCDRFNKSAISLEKSVQINDRQCKSTRISGTDRAKFFNIPLTNTKTISLKLNIPKDAAFTRLENDSAEKKQKYKTIGCQTLYREQSAQTRPWKPPAIISSDCTDIPPEIIDVADMLGKNDEINGNLNSPHEPGLYEAMLVERSRKRRDWERSLSPVTSPKEWLKRRVVLEAFEWNDWIGRERNIEYCQKLRLGIVKKMMTERKEDMLAKSKERLNMTLSRIDQLKEVQLKSLRIKHQRKLRKLELEHKNISKKYIHVDVATEHINKASNLYGPQKRFGVHPKHRHFMAHKTNYEARLDGLHRMQTKPIDVTPLIKQKIDLSKPKGQITEIKRGFWDEKCLGQIYNELTSLRFQQNPPKELVQCLKYIEDDVSLLLSSTPLTSARNINVDNEENYQMCLTMHKLIKGRAIQKIVCKGREKYRELIDELRSTHQLEAVQNCFKQCKEPGNNSLSELRSLNYQKQLEQTMLYKSQSQVQEVLDQAKGTTVSFILDLLDKEMTRLTELKKAHAISILVENERYRREAKDAEYRKKVTAVRKKDQEILQSVRNTRQKTVTEYLETVLLQHMDCLSQKTALDEIRQITRKIDAEADEIRDNENEKIISGIVNHFILPKVFQRISIDNYLDDIRTTIFGDPVQPDRSIQLLRFIENSISPRQLPPLPIIPSSLQSLSSLDEGEDVAHHEAMKAIGNAIQNAFNVIDPKIETPPIHPSGAYEILDDIVNEVVGTGVDKSTVDGQLETILVGVTDDLFGLMANELTGCGDLLEDVIQSVVPKTDDNN